MERQHLLTGRLTTSTVCRLATRVTDGEGFRSCGWVVGVWSGKPSGRRRPAGGVQVKRQVAVVAFKFGSEPGGIGAGGSDQPHICAIRVLSESQSRWCTELTTNVPLRAGRLCSAMIAVGWLLSRRVSGQVLRFRSGSAEQTANWLNHEHPIYS